MDLVVRTPHGGADVSVRIVDPEATLADLIALVTGQAVPPVADVDGRPVDTATRLGAAGLAAGTIVDTTPPDPPGPAPAIGLLQLAGRGAGTIRPLAPGRYRLGPGRRLHGSQLSWAPVEITALELTVGDDGTVEARPGYADPVSISGTRITGPTAWHGGLLEVGDRVFAVEAPWSPPAERSIAVPEADGSIPFGRPPRERDDRLRYVVVDALRDARAASGSLWTRRPGDRGAFVVPFGFAGRPLGPVTVDLAHDRGVAVIGDEDFREALARTLVVEATTLHGPADLRLAIAVDPERLATWDWAKWLPHLRDDRTRCVLTERSQLRAWVDRLNAHAVEQAGPETALTLLVTDDPALWTDRSSPLPALAASPPAGLRLLVLAAPDDVVPAVCSARISTEGDGRARLLAPDREIDIDGILPALTEIRTAGTVARHLAPLDDAERTPERERANEVGPATLAALLAPHPTTVDAIIDRWQRSPESLPERLAVPLGTSGGTPIGAELGPGRDLIVAGERAELAADVVLGVVAGLAVQLAPDRLSIVHVTTSERSTLDRIDGLPHLAGRFAEAGAAAATRLIVRMAAVARELDPSRRRIVAVVDDAGLVARSSPGLADGLAELAAALPALHVVLTVDRSRPERVVAGSFAAEVTVEESGGVRRGSLRIDDDRVHQPFAPFAGTTGRAHPTGLDVRPAVLGRPLTPLERRLDLLGKRDVGTDDDGSDEFDLLVGALSAAATHLERAPGDVLVPRPLPPLHRAETLLAETSGDAVPLGLVDVPERRETATLWWQPGPEGTMLFLGSPRSGVDAALATFLLGAASRLAADDVHLYAIDPLAARRAAVALLPHAGTVASPDRPDEVQAVLSWLTAQIEQRRTAPGSGADEEPALVLLVHDLGRLWRTAGAPDDMASRLEVIAGAGDVKVNLIATAWRAEEAGSLLGVVPQRFIGALVEPADYDLLGVIDPSAIEAQLGRCWSTARSRLVQLALPPASLVAELEAVGAEPATGRPPARPAPGRGTT